jgi:ferrochelatase
VIFSAHSLPRRILEAGDPYPDQLTATAAAVATRARLARWRIGWQSAGRTDEPWLGPDILDVIRDLAAAGATGIVVCPCGFVADHLEVLYDIDIEARSVAAEAGIPLVRTRSPNDDPEFLDALGSIVRRALGDRA